MPVCQTDWYPKLLLAFSDALSLVKQTVFYWDRLFQTQIRPSSISTDKESKVSFAHSSDIRKIRLWNQKKTNSTAPETAQKTDSRMKRGINLRVGGQSPGSVMIGKPNFAS